MDEWDVRHNRKTVVYINDEAWCLVEKQFFGKKEVRYILDPWPGMEIPGRMIRYGEEYVSNRDEALKRMRLESWLYPVLYVLKPLIGFLPSGVKAKIENVSGVSAREATMISILVEIFLFFASAIFGLVISADGVPAHNAIYWMGKIVFIQIVFLLLLLIDMLARYGSYLRDEGRPLGLFEWTWSWIGRR